MKSTKTKQNQELRCTT